MECILTFTKAKSNQSLLAEKSMFQGGLNGICSPNETDRSVQLKWQMYYTWGVDLGLIITYFHPCDTYVSEKICYSVLYLYCIMVNYILPAEKLFLCWNKFPQFYFVSIAFWPVIVHRSEKSNSIFLNPSIRYLYKWRNTPGLPVVHPQRSQLSQSLHIDHMLESLSSPFCLFSAVALACSCPLWTRSTGLNPALQLWSADERRRITPSACRWYCAVPNAVQKRLLPLATRMLCWSVVC